MSIDPTKPLIFESPDNENKQQGENRHKFANETSFKPGQSGNPKGRPPGTYSLTTVVKQRLSENPHELKEIIDALFAMAKKDVNAIKLIWQNMDGMPQQNVDLKGQIETITTKRAPTKKQLETK